MTQRKRFWLVPLCVIAILVCLAWYGVIRKTRVPETSVTVSALAEDVEQRFDKYDNLEFVYRVTAEATASPDATGTSPITTGGVLETTDVFRILSTSNQEGSTGRSRRCWIRSTIDDATETVDRFVAFDGSSTAQFWRRCHGVPTGQVVPWEIWDSCNENVFEQFLFLQPNGICRTMDVNGEMLSFNLNRYEVVQTKIVDSRQVFVLKAQGIKGNPAFDHIAYTVEVTGPRESMVIRWEAEDTKNNRPLVFFEVEEIKTFDSLPYPATGSFRQWAVGELPNHTYQFQVLSVDRLPETASENWVPTWPSGAIVSNQITGENFRAE